MTEQELEKIRSIIDGPIPDKNATQKEIHGQSVLYHKCAGSLLDEVKRLRAAIAGHKASVTATFPEYEPYSIDAELWTAIEECEKAKAQAGEKPVLFSYPCFQCAKKIDVTQIFCSPECKEQSDWQWVKTEGADHENG